ncbi:MAG: DNA oxidative demethylase AlkB [Pseudohongiellaceae bacterium]
MDLFDIETTDDAWSEQLDEGSFHLHGFVVEEADNLLEQVANVAEESPFRHLVTPGGKRMSVAMTNCGEYGWVSDRRGYRYQSTDPLSGRKWPEMPTIFRETALKAAESAGYPGFTPDVALINEYRPGTRLTPHQDKDEQDRTSPIVSISLGVPAVFLWGGLQRGGRNRRIPVRHGDVLVWGGPDRFRFHGIATLKEYLHPLTGDRRINITFRRTGLVDTQGVAPH